MTEMTEMTEMAEMALNEAGLLLVCSLSCCVVDVGIRCRFHDVYKVRSLWMGVLNRVFSGRLL